MPRTGLYVVPTQVWIPVGGLPIWNKTDNTHLHICKGKYHFTDLAEQINLLIKHKQRSWI